MSGTDTVAVNPEANVLSLNIPHMADDRSSEMLEEVILPFFEGLEMILAKRGYKVFLHNYNEEVYLGIMNDETDGFLVKVSMKHKDGRVIANYACMKTTSKCWETFEKNISFNEVPDAINTIAIGILGEAIFPKIEHYISQA
jgi:hypothetical protein